ncbi:hypothetical protein [Rhizobacter sp. SG703]|uniref:hypothetical protein n=1 Tax=Rhizobacter sp. SG703 TaxID=2587140 RepID=UPI0014462A84|nr:hypothetical protein [Rhizobacter sp. SG703]NKI95065.1 hypothetical protein [Rhizobacter sp. SG703]
MSDPAPVWHSPEDIGTYATAVGRLFDNAKENCWIASVRAALSAVRGTDYSTRGPAAGRHVSRFLTRGKIVFFAPQKGATGRRYFEKNDN